MRRLLAYISLATAMVAAVGVSANHVLTQVSSDNTYSNGRTITYRLSNKENGEELDQHEDAAKKVAETMEYRLKTWGVTSYDVRVLGNDTIETTFNASNDSEYQDISKYLSFSGRNFSLSTEDDSITFVGEEMFDEDLKATIVYENYAPVVLIPVNNGEKLKEAIDGKEGGGDENNLFAMPEGEEEDTSITFYLWSNRDEGETYSDAQKNPYIANKVVVALKSTNIFYGDDYKNLQIICGQMTEDGESYDITKVDQAYYTARRLTAMVNATNYDFQVEEIYSKVADAQIENLVTLNDRNRTIAMSLTLISSLIAVVFVTLAFYLIYKVGAITTGINLLVTLFLSVVILILFNASFNLAAFVGLALVGAINVFGGVTYLSRLRKEIAKGKSIKKANQESSSKSTMFAVDSSIVSIIFGLFVYLLGGSGVSSMGIVLIFGAAISLIVNIVVLKIMMYFLTNSKKVSNKPQLFGADVVKDVEIKDESNEPKEETKPAKNKKLEIVKKVGVGLFGAVGLVLSIVFASINGSVINATKNTLNARLFVELSDQTSQIADEDYLKDNVLANIYIGNHNEHNDEKRAAKTLKDYVVEVEHEEKDFYDKDTEDYTIKMDYYVVTFSNNFSSTDEIAYYVHGTTISDNGRLEDIVSEYLDLYDIDKTAVISLKEQSQIVSDTVSFNAVWATLIALGVSIIYLLIRFRLSRVLASVTVSVIAGAITLFVPVITRLPLTSLVYTSVIVVTLVTLLTSLLLLHADKEFRKDNKIVLNKYSKEERKEQLERSEYQVRNTSYLYVLLVICGFMMLFGFAPNIYSYTMIVCLVGFILSIIVISTFLVDISLGIETLTQKIRFRPRKNKKGQTKKTTSEPEEAPIIGINI